VAACTATDLGTASPGRNTLSSLISAWASKNRPG